MKKIQILEEAFKLFAIQGYESTSMQQIAVQVGLRKSSLYGHYVSKMELFKALLLNEFQSIEIHLLEGIQQDETLYILLVKIFRNMVTYFKNKDKLLFWKQVVLLAAIDSDKEVCELVRSVVQSFDNKIMWVLSKSAEMSNIDRETQQKMSLFFLIITQGFLDWFLIQKEIDDNIISMSIEMFNSIIKNVNRDDL